MFFTNEYSFLSNFYPSQIEISGIVYPTSEHAFQAMKTNSIEDRKHIASLETPGKAKRYGRKVELVDNWDTIKSIVMINVLDLKFADMKLRTMLRGVKGNIVEHNVWHDNYWGQCVCENCGDGKNVLGSHLEYIRSQPDLYFASVE